MATQAAPLGPTLNGEARLELFRARLVDRVRKGVRGPLTVISAPAGYGKTVLLRDWASMHDQSMVVSLALRPDDDLRRIGARLVAVLAEFGASLPPWTVGRIGEDDRRFGEPFVEGLLEGLEALGDAVLVVDGLDALTDGAVVEELERLIERVVPALRVVVARRSQWPDPKRRFRRRDVAWLTADDLAFTADEARELVRDVVGLELSESDLANLMERTEGWPYGLHVAVAGLFGRSEPGAYIEGFTGSDRRVAALFAEEVLAGVPADERRFLLQTSVLERLSGPLCQAVTGEADAAERLRKLAGTGCLTRSIGRDGEWFVYHGLLRDFLRNELRLEDPPAEAELLLRAAEWHPRRKDPEAAADYLIEAGRWDALLDLVDRTGLSMVERGAAAKVIGWIEAIPASADSHERGLALRRAYLHTVLGQSHRAEQVLHGLDPRERSAGEHVVVNALRATWTFFDAAPGPAIDAADHALAALEQVDGSEVPDIFGVTSPAILRMMASTARARAGWYMGDVAGSRDALTSLTAELDSYTPLLAKVLGTLALLEAWAGNFNVAQQHATKVFVLMGRAGLPDHPATLDTRLAAAHVARQRGDLVSAVGLLDEAYNVATRVRRPITCIIHSIERALVHLAEGSPERGLDELDRVRSSGWPPPPPAVADRLKAAEIRLLLAVGESKRAQSILNAAERPLSHEMSRAAVEIAVADRDLEAGRAVFASWPMDPAQPVAQLERDLWEGVVEFEAGNRRQAIRSLGAVVDEAEREGHVRLLLEVGRPGARLLRAVSQVVPNSYARDLVGASGSVPRESTGSGGFGLSERELEVVRYLPTPMSSADIAAQLYISRNTLKTHLRTIYQKLEVRGRSEACARAKALGIA